MREKQWKIDILIDEYDDRTRAKARLHNPDETGLVGVGTARLNPSDANVPEIGDELARRDGRGHRGHYAPAGIPVAVTPGGSRPREYFVLFSPPG
jgi:uncharacterized protein DUF1876